MLRFFLRRLVVAIPTMFLVITVAFFLMRTAPGSPFDSERKLPPEILKNVEAKYGFDDPLHVQYVNYLGDVLKGDLGPSLKYKDKQVVDLIAEGFPKSMMIGLSALTIAAIIGMFMGTLAALRQNRSADYAATAVAILGVTIPTFVTAPLLVLLFGATLRWLPSGGWVENPLVLFGQPVMLFGKEVMVPAIKNLIMPVIVLALPQIAIISRLTRAGMIEVLRSNYIRTARAKGLAESRIVRRHAVRAAILPLVSYLGPAMAALITGSLVVEQIFQLPGLGKFFVTGALQRDYTVVMGVVILYAGLIILLNLLADLIYAALDPRVRLS